MKKVDGLFVTGTDTGVGKTVISTVLTLGLHAMYWKPVQTGTREGSDSSFVKEWVGAGRVQPEVYSFSEPLSPHAASLLECQAISVETILHRAYALKNFTVIEGAGGIMVPLNEQDTVLDLIVALRTSAVVVGLNKLGTINHSLLTLQALHQRQVPVCGVVLTGEPNSVNRLAIERYGNAPVLGEIPYCESFTWEWMRTAFRRLDTKIFETLRRESTNESRG